MGLVGRHAEATEVYERLRTRDPARAWTSGQVKLRDLLRFIYHVMTY